MSTAVSKPPLNVRMLIFGVVSVIIIGFPVYVYVHEIVTQGVVDYGSFKLVDLRAMSNFEMDQVNATIDDVPQNWRGLDGNKVALEGEMYAPNSAAPEINKFDLVYSISKCCFNGQPKVQHFVNSSTSTQSTVPHYSGLVRVIGTLHVNVKHDAGKVSSVYQLDVDSVEPK